MFSYRVCLLFVLLLAPLAAWPAQPADESLLTPARQLLAQAEQLQASTLAPEHYARGTRALAQAERNLTDGRDTQRVRGKALQAEQELQAAVDQAKRALTALTDSLNARNAAADAQASRLAEDEWHAAEKSLSAAARSLENDKQEKAGELSARATTEYRRAELKAIKANILTSARRALAEARQKRADRYAPRGLAAAQSLLDKAGAVLDDDRHQTDRATALAASAAYEARHAIRISSLGQRIRSGELSIEDLILEWESSLRKLADLAGQDADFSKGYAATRESIASELARIPRLEEDLEQRNRQVAELEEEIRELDQRLSDASAERRALIRELQARARLREQFAAIEDMFSPSEAIVLREGNSLILRLTGLQFGSGSARLNDKAKTLLAKLRDAANTFPRSRITVEGHTDASGDPGENLDLSERRATAVANYLRSQLGIEGFRLKSVGYGDTRPIASNRSAKGRARNRRIDILLEPQPGSIG